MFAAGVAATRMPASAPVPAAVTFRGFHLRSAAAAMKALRLAPAPKWMEAA